MTNCTKCQNVENLTIIMVDEAGNCLECGRHFSLVKVITPQLPEELKMRDDISDMLADMANATNKIIRYLKHKEK